MHGMESAFLLIYYCCNIHFKNGSTNSMESQMWTNVYFLHTDYAAMANNQSNTNKTQNCFLETDSISQVSLFVNKV